VGVRVGVGVIVAVRLGEGVTVDLGVGTIAPQADSVSARLIMRTT
jgi:hypothetical protein